MFSGNLPGECPHGSSSSSWSFCGDNLSISCPAILGAEDPHHLERRSSSNLNSIIFRIFISNLQPLPYQLLDLGHIEPEDGGGGDDVLTLALPLKVPNNATDLSHVP